MLSNQPISDGANKIPNWIKEKSDFLLASLITLACLILTALDMVSVSNFSPTLAAGIFTVIIASIGTLFSVLVVYDELIAAADKLDYLNDLKKTFKNPVLTAVVGFTIAVLGAGLSLPTKSLSWPDFFLSGQETSALAMMWLLLYSIFSFYAAFDFMIETIAEMNTK